MKVILFIQQYTIYGRLTMLNTTQLTANFKSMPSSPLTPLQQKATFQKLYKLINQYEQNLKLTLETYATIYNKAIPFLTENNLHKSKYYKPAQLQLDKLNKILRNLHDTQLMLQLFKE